MGLGNNASASLRKPEKSVTAHKIIATVSDDRKRKNIKMQIRLPNDELQMFKEICEKRDLVMSEAIRNYIKEVIRSDGEVMDGTKEKG